MQTEIKYQVSRLNRNIAIAIVIMVYLFFLLDVVFHTRTSINQPFPGFLLLRNNLVPVVYLPKWEGFQRGIKFGDIVLSVNGKPVSNSREVKDIAREAGVGTPLTYTIQRGKAQLDLTIPVSVFTLSDYLTITLLWILLGTSFYLTGLGVFYLKPNTMASHALLFQGTLGGLSMIAVPGYVIDNSNLYPLVFLTFNGPSVFS